MIQNYLAEPLVKNYTAPKYPLFIALQNCLNAINHKKTMRDAKTDIASFVDKIGSEGQKFVLNALMDSLELPEFTEKANQTHKLALLIQCLTEYSQSQNFLFYFPQVLAKQSKQSKLASLLNNLFEKLKLPFSARITIALSLYLSDKMDFIQQGESWLIVLLKQLNKNKNGQQISHKILDQLLFQISRNPELEIKLQEEYSYLLEMADKNIEEQSSTKIYKFINLEWQDFSNQFFNNERPVQPSFKKVDYIKQLGPCITFQPETLKNVLNDIGPLSEDDIFQILHLMADDKTKPDSGFDRFVADYLFSSNRKNGKIDEIKKSLPIEFNSKKVGGTWNVDNFLNVCNQLYPNLKWQNIFGALDRPKLCFSSEDHFLALMKLFQKSKKLVQKWKIPQNIYLKKWNNLSSQALFFIYVFTCKDPESLFLNEIQNKKIQKTVRECNVMQKQIWGFIDLVQILIEISDFKYISIRQIFDIPMTKYPQLLLLTLSEIRPSKGQALLDEILSNLLPQYLQNHSTNTKLLDPLWENNQDLVISCICQIYKSESKKQNAFNLSRVLDITQSIKDSLIPFTTWNDYQFSIPLAVIAGKREFLNFEPWFIDRIQKLSNSFVRAILLYIQNYLVRNLRTMAHPTHKESVLEKAQLTIQLLNKIFYTIMSKLKREDIEPRNLQLLKRLFKECCQNFPEITENQIPDEIQRQTEREINRIYKQQITIKEAIQRMKKLKNSNKQEDQEQFASHITFLCSELSYLHTYPEKYLMITADLFAALINSNLVQKKIFTMFLNVLQDGLKQDNSKYIFSLKVIQKIKPKLVDENWFCFKLIDNETIMRKNPQIVEQLITNLTSPKSLSLQKQKKIKEAIKLKNTPPPIEQIIEVIVPREQQLPLQTIKKVQQSDDYEILVNLDSTKRIQIADKETKLSKINMICNTLSTNNLQQKSKDLKKIIEGDSKIIKLLANNIVFKRITITQNNGGFDVILKLVQKIPIIEQPILKTTYKILRQWFALKGKSVNDKKLASFKNIGAWLGKLTIGKGMPIPMHKINIKQVLIDSYTNSVRLSLNIPVVLKILQLIHTNGQKIKPTSPWLSRIIGTLSEIEDKLKDEQSVNTKNQIKAFFKNVNMKIENFPANQTSFLNLSNNSNRIIISSLDKCIKIDEQLQRKYSMKIDLKAIITKAVNDSIQQIVQPVIDRAVKIAKVTTKQLITKDFAYEPDPERFRESSYKLVKQMAGPLAQVTCRQPLKASMNRSLKMMLGSSFEDVNQIQNIIQKAIADNLDFGCTLIKQAVINQAEEVIKKDPIINQSIQMRVSAKMQGLPFESIQMEIPAIVPEELRPRIGGLSAEQYEVYSQFKKQRTFGTSQKVEEKSNVQKVVELIMEKGSVKLIKDLIQNDMSSKDEILNKIHSCLAVEANDDSELEYYIEVCEVLKQFFDPRDCWKSFKQLSDLKKKQIHRIVRKLVRQKYFPQNALNQLDKSNEEQNKVITLFEKWLEIAHEGIEPFLRSLEQMFNKSENQIKIFFSCSLQYAMQKVSESFSLIHNSYDTNYIENYTKLIIISYKTIASNNCSLYLEHTIQAILDVFNKLQNTPSEFSYQRPFFKLFTNLICDVTRKQYDIDHEKVLTFYCVLAKELQKIGPLTCPNFTCAWMELICNKNFMPSLLERYEYWDLYYNLLNCLFKFVRQYITEQNLVSKQNSGVYQSFYMGFLRLILVLIHDFPGFLSEFSLQLSLLINPRFTQLNNMIVSAYPKQMIFESPFKIDKREDLVVQCLKGGMPKYYRIKFDKPNLNYYLQTDPKESSFKEKLSREDDQSIQILVLYASWTQQNQLNEAESMKRLTEILIFCNEETSQKIIFSILNLIRYPNMVTLFFLDLVMSIIFSKNVKDSSIRDQVLAATLARTNTNGPHSWGEHYLGKQIQIHYKELQALGVPTRILELI